MALNTYTTPEWIEYGERATADNDPIYGANGIINRPMVDLREHGVAISKKIDTTQYAYASTTSITIYAGSVWGSADGSETFYLDSNATVTLSGNLATGQSLTANKFYYLWGGKEGFFLSVEKGALPSNLTTGRRLRGGILLNNSSQVTPFFMTKNWMMYDIDMTANGSDATEIQDGTIGTSFTALDCGEFVPDGQRNVQVILGRVTANNVSYYRSSGSSATIGLSSFVGAAKGIIIIGVDNNGGFYYRQSISENVVISVQGYELDLAYSSNV